MRRCSFCRKSENEVAKVVAGPRVYICDRCVKIAGEIMDRTPHAPRRLSHRSASKSWIDRLRGLRPLERCAVAAI